MQTQVRSNSNMDSESSISIATNPKTTQGQLNVLEAETQASLNDPVAQWTKQVDHQTHINNDNFVEDDIDDNESEQNFESVAPKTRFVRLDSFDIFEKSKRSTAPADNRRKIKFNDQVTYLTRSFSCESSLESSSRRSSINFHLSEDERCKSDLERSSSPDAFGADFGHDSEHEYCSSLTRSGERSGSKGVLKSRSASIKPRVMCTNTNGESKCVNCSEPYKAQDKINSDDNATNWDQIKRLSISPPNQLLPMHIFSPRHSLPILCTSLPVQQPTGGYCQLAQQQILISPQLGYQPIGYIPVSVQMSPQHVGGYSGLMLNDPNSMFPPCQHQVDPSALQNEQQSHSSESSNTLNPECGESNANICDKSCDDQCKNVRYDCISSVSPNLKCCECQIYQN